MDYSKTLNLPETEFPMRAGLPEREPEILKYWYDNNIYEKKQKLHAGHKKFVLHDGPPYANGQIHMGTALNKILKDIIMKYKYTQGYDTPYVPGWDTHGMPIEHAAIKNLGLNRNELDPLVLRNECKNYALQWIDIQRNDFKRLGVLGDWDHPYVTLVPDYEAVQIHVFGEMAKKGYIYKGQKSVYWCPHCETALAEAEIEYAEQKTPAIYVKMPIVKDNGMMPEAAKGKPAYMVIWTTTPWTMPANVAVALHPDIEYAWVECEGEVLFLAKELLEQVGKVCKKDLSNVLGTCKGKDMEFAECRHPFDTIERKSIVVLADYVTLDAGTGCVHTAPGHGDVDFETGIKYHLPIICPVDKSGKFTKEAKQFEGMFVFDANIPILKYLAELGMLFGKENIRHQYAHCWRCKNPIIYRATEQWFASIDGFRDDALAAIANEVKWIPSWGESRIHNMVADRNDWCISRQRVWGVPIPAFYCEECGKPMITDETINAVADLFKKEGSDAWWKHEAEEILPEGTTCPHCGGKHFTKESDIMDVWFDSGSSHAAVAKVRPELAWPVDMYLEGSDQHRGWFHSSLLTGCAIDGRAPYKGLLTHGFTVDEQGRKMSKSLGNVIAPSEINDKYGAEILRLWVASSDYTGEISLGEKILKGTVDAYRRFRNTIRFLLANTSDFDIKKDAVPVAEMVELDRWAIARMKALQEEILDKYDHYQFHTAYAALQLFASGDLGGFYLDILKDRLYTTAPDSAARRSAQTALWYITDALLKLLAPALSFTAEEAYAVFNPENKGTIFVERYAELPNVKEGVELLNKWSIIRDLRSNVQMEIERQREKGLIGSSLQAEVSLKLPQEEYDLIKGLGDEAAFVMITSKVTLDGVSPERVITVKPSEAKKCERCWQYKESVGEDKNYPTLCCRCVGNLFGTPETRLFA